MVKNSKRLGFVIIMMAFVILCFSACSSNHVHAYLDGWEYDETYHWRKATCGDIEIGLKGKHNFLDNVCTLCGYDKNDPNDTPDIPDEPNLSDDPNISENPNPPNDSDTPEDSDRPNDSDAPDEPNFEDPNTPSEPQEPFPGRKYSSGESEVSDYLQYTELLKDGALVGYSVGKAENSTVSGVLQIVDSYKGKPVLEIDEFGFEDCTGLEIVTLPNQLETIGYGAFSNCTVLTEITIPESVTYIDMQAFRCCSALKFIALPKLDAIKYELFYKCDRLEKIEIPEGVKTIEKLAFYACKSLKEIKLPSTLTSIGKEAFNACYNIEKVDLADIDAWCSVSIADETANPLRNSKILCSNGRIVTEIKIPKIEKISKFQFCGCNSIKSIVIPSSVKDIESRAFTNSSLEKITFEEGLINIYEHAFSNCKNLKEVSLPDSVKYIESEAFFNCSALEKFVFGKGIETIGSYSVGVQRDMYRDPNFKIYYRGSSDEWSRVNKAGDWNFTRPNEIIFDYKEA